MRTVTTVATVEISLPDVLDAEGYQLETVGNNRRGVKINLVVNLKDFVLRIPSLPHGSQHLLTIKHLRLRGVYGDMLPVLDEENGAVMFFTTELVEGTESPDEPTVLDDCGRRLG